MTDERHADTGHGPAKDGELNVKAILGTGLALLVATALGMAVSWWLSVDLREYLEGHDPQPPALREAQIPWEPPGPRLQTNPADELATARAEEDALLETYEWGNADQSEARVPIERGMEILLESRPGAEAFGDAVSPHGSPAEEQSPAGQQSPTGQQNPAGQEATGE